MGKYEYAHAPSSAGSLYNERRAAFRKKMARYADEDGDGGGPESEAMETAGRRRVSRPTGDHRPDT